MAIFKSPFFKEGKTEEEEVEIKYSEKLSRLAFRLIILTIIVAVCWFLRSVLGYMILAALVTVLANPVCNLICKIHIKDHHCPRWVGTIVSILAIFLILAGAITLIVPLITSISQDISRASVSDIAQSVSVPLANFNSWIVRTIPMVGADFKIENFVLTQVQGMFHTSDVTNVVGSVTSFVANLGVGLFAIIFISFFFINTPGLIVTLCTAMVPDKYEKQVKDSLSESGVLISRYFIGMAIEVLGVTLVNFLGLLIIAKMGFKYSLGIAFMMGVMNIVPYIGPLIGIILGVSMSLVIKYVCASSFGLAVGFLPFILILVAIFLFTQLVDNTVYQPLIYSNSVKVHPLEIFIVFLIAGEIGGMFGMFAAIPAYTVLRVVAKQFLGNVKPVRELTSTNPK